MRFDQARIMHRFLSRSDESDDLTRRGGTRLRVGGPRKRTVGYVEEADKGVPACGSLRQGADDFATAVENLCIFRARANPPLRRPYQAGNMHRFS